MSCRSIVQGKIHGPAHPQSGNATTPSQLVYQRAVDESEESREITANVAEQDASISTVRGTRLPVVSLGGVRVASTADVPEIAPSTVPSLDRRAMGAADRRKNSRSGRRSTDPHVDW